MRRRLWTALGIGLAGSLLLTGCVPGLDRNSWPTPLPSAEQPGSTPGSPTVSSPQTVATGSSSPTIGASLPGSATVGAYDVRPLPEYAGPRPLPASDGKPMLWPVSVPVSMYLGYQQIVRRSGFLDVTGKLVLPQRYESYQYCPDETGRPVLLIANRDGDARAEVFDLTGRRLATLPTARGDCAGPSYVVTTNDGLDEASTQADIQNGLYELATGKWLIPPIRGRQLASLRPGLINVTERTGEYFLDLTSGRKVPHVGWVPSWAILDVAAPGLPASTRRDSGKIGFIGLNGKWIVQPDLSDAEPFDAGLAVLQPSEGTFTLLDSALKRRDGEWSEVSAPYRTISGGYQTVGHLASGPVGQALYGGHGQEVVPVGTGRIKCADAGAACSVRLPGGRTQLVALPDGATTELPAGFDTALSPRFAESSERNAEGHSWVYSLSSGKSIETVGRSACLAVGTDFLDCTPDSEVLPHAVIGADGPMAFASVSALDEPGRPGETHYYQATTAKFTGIVDASGAWLYRQSSYLRLDD